MIDDNDGGIDDDEGALRRGRILEAVDRKS